LIAWLDGDSGCKFTATLRDISTDGARVETDFSPLPPPGTLVLVRLGGDASERVMRAKIVDVATPQTSARFSFRRRPERTGARIHLVFLESCPYELFKAAISGFVVERAGPRRSP
jgi:hypothetical protein